MAILLQEEGLYDRTTIYATDFNQSALNSAKEGIFSNINKRIYRKLPPSGGKESFSNYYIHYDNVIMNPIIKKNIVWANHNLVTDSVLLK
jgi:chemotaxis protein methyltransferase CheR